MINRNYLITFIVSAAVPLGAFSQGSPTASNQAQSADKPSALAPSPSESAFDVPTSAAPDAADLTTLLKDFLAGASRNDVAMHDRFWADDLIYTASAGRRFGKADLMREVRQEAQSDAAPESTIYTAEDIRIQQYDTTAIVAFRLVATTKKGDSAEVTNYMNSGTFLKRSGEWRAVNWQATRVPAGEPSRK